MANAEIFQFAVDSALLGELGEKLVSTVQVALSELVKNAYDADAKKVIISIEPTDAGAPMVIIEDDGNGMTPEDVKKFWMKIGTSNKQADPVSRKYGRPKTGSKGVGRFACRRLGLHLRLTTQAFCPSRENRLEQTEIEFNWAEFEPGVDVESVKCSGSTKVLKQGLSGTRLEIWGGPYNEWQTRGFNYLQRQLVLLASNRGVHRPSYEEDPGFNVVLKAPDLSDGLVDIRDSIISGCWGTVSAEVDMNGRAVCTLNAKGLGGTKRLTSSPQFSRIAGAKIHIGILPARRDEARKPELLANYVLNELIEEWGGVHIRLNGFRVYPYGDPRDDWLEIDKDRGRRHGRPEGELFTFAASLDKSDASRALLNMLGMRNYIGQVDVDSNIPGLTPRLDRQGFLETDTFAELRKFSRFVIDWANIYRDHYIRIRENEEAEKARIAIKPMLNLDGPKEKIIPKAASFLRGEIRRIVSRLPASQQKETEQVLVRTVRAIEATSNESLKQLEHLRLVASASTLTLLFAHEVRTVIGSLGAAALRLQQLSKKMPSEAEGLNLLAQQLTDTKERFDSLISMTGIVGAFRNNEGLIELHLQTAIERAIRCFQLIIGNYDIRIDIADVSPEIMVGPMIGGELYTILLNLISNSVKAVIASGEPQRLIRIEAAQYGKKVRIKVQDNGLGLAEEFFEEVFTPFISDPSGELYDQLEAQSNPEDSSIFGTGSGLGLSIARDIARARDGDVRFVAAENGWKTCVEIELP